MNSGTVLTGSDRVTSMTLGTRIKLATGTMSLSKLKYRQPIGRRDAYPSSAATVSVNSLVPSPRGWSVTHMRSGSPLWIALGVSRSISPVARIASSRAAFRSGRSIPSASRNVAPSSRWKKKRGIVVAPSGPSQESNNGAGELFPHARNRRAPARRGLGLRPWGLSHEDKTLTP